MSLLGATESERLNYRHAIQVVFQNPAGSLNPNLTNGRSISEPLYASGALRGRAATDPVTDALVSVGLETAVAERYPGELSGGQQQRVAIARAATTTPRILFADECVSALDVSVQARVLQLLRRLRDELGFALVFVTHDLSVVRALCDSVLVLKEGKAVEQGPADEFFRSPQHPYSKTLLAAAEATHLSREDSQTP
jgi:peptide/nickel transport system ATP-binding protein